ncbi:MAG TPA: helix-turn-helix domain-containing protein, partial [Geothrix sp.]|nr:helix-turn-helix domain-containing protein [Geothrix sp.]
LATYAWPGNVRELKNVLERAYLLEAPPSTFLLGPGMPGPVSAPTAQGAASLQTLEELEQAHLLHALRLHQGNYTRTAEALGISLSTLKRRVKERPALGSI